MARRKTTPSKSGKQPADDVKRTPSINAEGDAALIRLCCTITADYAAFHGAFRGDPDKNNTAAEMVAYHYLRKAKKDMKAAAGIPASTVHGLSAKASAVRAAMLPDDGLALEEHAGALVLSLTADTIRIAGQIGDQEWIAKGGAAS